MNENCSGKSFDLEERTFLFAKAVRKFVKTLPYTIANSEDAKQLVRASGSIGANYIEANESLGKKDFLMHLRISLKEAKESKFWLRLICDTNYFTNVNEVNELIKEAQELKLIFASIIQNSK